VNFANPYQAAARGFINRVIEPKDSRPEIINALRMLAAKRESRPAKHHVTIPRLESAWGERQGETA
jgi:acetyl-CoA carboxylase carboxyltransferase component